MMPEDMKSNCASEDTSQSAATCYKALIDKYDEYLLFLNEANEGPIMMAHAHGWRCSPKLVEKGKEFRAEIERLKAAL